MTRGALLMLAVLGLAGCYAPLPGDYTVNRGDRGKAWLQNPDGTIAHAGLITQLHRDDRRILLVAYPVMYGGKVAAPAPIDDTCYVALLIEAPEQRTTQIRISEANRLAASMESVVSYDRPCLEGMPNA